MKEILINKIWYMLQRYGERDDDGFSMEFTLNDKPYTIFLHFNYDEEGEELMPSCGFFSNSYKLHAPSIYHADEKELQGVYDYLISLIEHKKMLVDEIEKGFDEIGKILDKEDKK